MSFLLRTSLRISLLPLLILTSLGCDHYEVLATSGPPSGLVGTTTIAVTYDYSQIAISDKRMTEQQWLDSREQDDHRKTYLETKDSANSGFLQGISGKLGGITVTDGVAPAGTVQATVIYEEWEEGLWTPVVSWNSKITARVVFMKDGQVLDDIRVKTQEGASMTSPAPQQRLNACGKRLGQFAAEYVINVAQ